MKRNMKKMKNYLTQKCAGGDKKAPDPGSGSATIVYRYQ
jgi:hypothetical protein